ncbi:MAG: hypothetical protein LBR39_03160 [Coriobacteriales bacterium]|nr:hypothetical protein [Coriobacteriales bacterium]
MEKIDHSIVSLKIWSAVFLDDAIWVVDDEKDDARDGNCCGCSEHLRYNGWHEGFIDYKFKTPDSCCGFYAGAGFSWSVDQYCGL